MKWTKLFPKTVLTGEDFVNKIEIADKTLCAIKTGSKIYVVQNRCPHAGADLSHGWCNNENIVCPYHRYEFDLNTGRGKEGQGNYINIYPVEIREDGIYVGIKESWWKFW